MNIKRINAADIRCNADEIGAQEFEIAHKDGRRVRVCSHDRQLAAEAAAAFFAGFADQREESPELFA